MNSNTTLCMCNIQTEVCMCVHVHACVHACVCGDPARKTVLTYEHIGMYFSEISIRSMITCLCFIVRIWLGLAQSMHHVNSFYNIRRG